MSRKIPSPNRVKLRSRARKSRAGGEQRRGGVRLGVQPARSDDLGEQGAGLGGIEHIEIDEAAADQVGYQPP
jgi:hypothetical protein